MFNKIVYLFFIFFFIKINSAQSDALLDKGKEIFLNQGMCTTCHILKSANSTGEIGPNLDQLKPLMSQVIVAVKNGIGVMPAFEGLLSSDEIEAVAYFVSKSVEN